MLGLQWLLVFGLCVLNRSQATDIEGESSENEVDIEDVPIVPACNPTWVQQCGKALYGLNDKNLRNVDRAEDCQAACMAETEFTCLSIDYLERGSCYLSRDSALTRPEEMGNYPGCDHYDLVCSKEEADAILFEPVEDTDCGYMMTCKTALYSHNTKTVRDQTLDECKLACINEESFDCLSFDYNPSSKKCYLSEDSSNTDPQDMGMHADTDYFEKSCTNDNTGGSGDSDSTL